MSQVIRLASNLVLTRLLFPEAFGLMSLVTVLMVGVSMLADVGIGSSVSQSKRGDDIDFLNTAWTLQILRGAAVWVALCLLAWPASLLYSDLSLTYFLPVAGLSVLINGFNPMRLETANRHLMLGRVTILDLCSQVGTILVTILLAWMTGSVWALVIGIVFGAVLKLVLANLMLPGERDRLHWEPSAVRELVAFGIWIIPSTAFGFMLAQGDRVILGVYLSLEMLGIYNIGQFFAAAPIVLAMTVTGRVFLPLYREQAADGSAHGTRKLRLFRAGLTGATMLTVLGIALIGVPLIHFLYDARYAGAGAILVVVALVQLPIILGFSYDRTALAAGDTRSFFFVTAFRSSVQTIFFVVGAEYGGLLGALIGQGLAGIVAHLSLIWLANKHKGWDPVHDAVFSLLAIAGGSLVIWLNWATIAVMASGT